MEQNNNFDIENYKEKINSLSQEELDKRNIYLKNLGPRPNIEDITPEMENEVSKKIENMIQGPTTMYASVDKPFLYKYDDKDIVKKEINNSFYGYLYDCCKDYMDEIAFTFEGYKPTKREVFEEIVKTEDMLRNEKNIKAGDVVCVAPINQPESLYIIYALNKIGAKVSIIDPRANAFTLKNDINESNPKLFIGSTMACKEFKKIKKELSVEDYLFINPLESCPSKIKKTIVNSLIRISSPFIKKRHLFNKIKNKYDKKSYTDVNFASYENKKDDSFDFIMHTGGTTGVHKGVELTGNAFNHTVMEHNVLMDGIVFRGDALVNPMPQFITYGMTTMHLALCKGFNMVMLFNPTTSAFVDAVIDNKAPIVYGSPVFWEAFIKSNKAKKENFSYSKVRVSGGEKTTLTTKENVNKFFKDRGSDDLLIDGYGLSEVTGVFSVALNENSINSQGQPLAHNNIGVYDRETGKELQIGQSGEFYIESEAMMNGYYKNEEENNRVIYDNHGRKMIKTGDAGYVNAYGELINEGRYKRIFVCGVDKVYQERMEEIICELPFVDKCVITRIPVYDNDLKAVPKAHVVLKEEYVNNISASEVEKKITNLVAIKISDKVVPRYFEIQDKIKFTPNGKVDFTTMTMEDQEVLNKLYPDVVKPFEEVDKFATNVGAVFGDDNEQKKMR